MKGLKKLALVSAIAMTSAGAFAMEAADDSVLSDTTGQSGITIDVAPGTMLSSSLSTAFGVTTATINAMDATAGAAGGTGTAGILHGLTVNQVIVHDSDAFTGATGAGAIVIGDGTVADSTVVFANDVDPIVIDVDAASNGGSPILNVKITTPTLAIKTGSINVATSNGVGSTVANVTKILSGMEIVLGATTINVQLGHEAQTFNVLSPMGSTVLAAPTALAVVNATLSGGLSIAGTKIDDNGGTITGGSIYVGKMAIKDHGGADLTAKVGVNVASDLTDSTKLANTCSTCFGNDANAATGGLVVTLGQLGTNTGGIDIAITNGLTLGATTSPSLGEVEVLGLNLNGTSLIIHGH